MSIHSIDDVLAALRRHTDQDEPDSPQAHKRRRIVQAAAAELERHGYRRASMSAIAKQAAVAKGTLYLYFPSKAELLLDVLMWERAQLYERMAPALSGKQTPRQRLRALLVQAVLHHELMPVSNLAKAGDPELIAALGEVDVARLRAAVALFGEIFRWLVGSVAPGLAPEELGERSQVLIGLLQAVPSLARVRGGLSLERFAERFADLLIDGVAAAPKED